jgi:hypothetical protein
MTGSHNSPPKPTPIVALVCLAVVARLCPGWVAVKLSDAAKASRVSPQRLSRLCSGAIALFETAVATLRRIGRPPRDDTAAEATTQRDLLAALLDVATSLLSRGRLRGVHVRALVVGAWLRLKAAHPRLTRKSFCAALAVPATAPPGTLQLRRHPPRHPGGRRHHRPLRLQPASQARRDPGRRWT